MDINARPRSDTLPKLRQSFADFKFAKDYWQVQQEHFVLDANIVLPDVAWMARRAKPEAQTELREALLSGVMVAHAPTYLLKEMAINLPKYAEGRGIDLEKMHAEWTTLQQLITFRDTGEDDPSFTVDPKDAPYVVLAAILGIPILTMDSDIKKLGAHAMPPKVIRHVRDYARHTTAEHQLKLMGLGSVQAGGMLLPLAFKVVQEICKEHTKTAIAVGALLLTLYMSNKSRQEKVSKALKTVGNRSLDLFNEHQLAKQAGEKSRDEVTKLREQTKPVPSNKRQSDLG